jgi:uncharacterized membrane protein YbaN (DUF454 family)
MKHLAIKTIKSLWVAAGFLFTGVGIIGMITPLMPGLVFFIIASYCFAKGSRKFLRMLISNRYVGQQILDFKHGKGMTRGTKATALMVLWIGVIISAFFVVEKEWVKLAILSTGVVVSVIILSQKSKQQD